MHLDIFLLGKFISFANATSDVHEKVSLLDVRDSSVRPVISGGDLWHPDIWIEK